MITSAREAFEDYPERQLRRPGRKLMWLFALAVLLPSLYGFGTKFIEFIVLFRGEADGAFAITPILNYLLASCGFLLLFGWAALGGMFRNVEQPKYQMLENEAWLDRLGALDRDAATKTELAPATIPFPAARLRLLHQPEDPR
jgi:hypothetical protein